MAGEVVEMLAACVICKRCLARFFGLWTYLVSDLYRGTSSMRFWCVVLSRELSSLSFGSKFQVLALSTDKASTAISG